MAESAKKKTAPKTDDSKRKAFEDLATVRVNKALKALRQLRSLSNKSAYVYTPAQVEKICSTLAQGVDTVRASFANPSAVKSEGFKL